MRKLIVAVVIVVGLGTVGDLSARVWTQGQITRRAKAELPPEVGVNVHVHGFPFLLPLALAGRVSKADAHFTKVSAGALALAAVDVELRGVKIDQHVLLGERRVELVSIRDGTVTAEITAAALTNVLKVPITIGNGQVKAEVAGATIGVRVAVLNNAVVLSSGPVRLSVPIPKTRLVTCAADVIVLVGRLSVSCTIHEIPPLLLDAANVRTA